MVEPVERRLELRDMPDAPLRRMMEIRYMEDRIQALFDEGEVRGTTHLAAGQEAVAVSLAAATEVTDPLTCTYRGHAYALALGIPIEAVLAEILGRTSGCAGGMGGSMHLAASNVGLLPTFAIVGAGIPVAAGAAFAAKYRGSHGLAVAVFGDGATNIGAFHETLNISAVLELPLLFVCENNLYGEYSPVGTTTAGSIAERPKPFGIPSLTVDGQDYALMSETFSSLVAEMRQTGGPRFVEALTYRYSGHSRSDPGAYRPEGELDQWLRRDPLTLEARRLLDNGLVSEERIRLLEQEAATEVESALELALGVPEPEPHTMFLNIYAT